MPATDADGESHPDRKPWRQRRAARRHVRRCPRQGARAERSRKAMSSSIRSTIRRSSRARGRSALEMLEAVPDLDALVVPIGGGGLMSGIAIAARALKPDIELIGVEAELYPSMKCAIEDCHMPLGGDTLAEGIAVKQPGELTSRILKDLADDVVLVSERDLERAVAMLAGIEKTRGRRRRRGGSRRAARRSRAASPGKKVGDDPVRRQYRHASARQRAGPRPRAQRANRAAARSRRRTSPARWPRSPPNSTRRASTSSRSTTAASSAGFRPRTR